MPMRGIVRIFAGRQRQLHRLRAGRIEAGIDGERRAVAAGHLGRAGQEHHREGDLHGQKDFL